MVTANIEALERNAQALITARTAHENTWKDCLDHSWPLRTHGLSSDTVDAQSGQRKRADLLDSTSTDAGNVLVAATVGGMTPANQRWFSLGMDGISDEAKAWLDEAATTVWRNMHQANFDSTAPECLTDVVGAGWGALYIDADRDSGGYLFDWWPIGGVYIATSKAGGPVDIVLRKFCLTAEQCVSQYGEDMVSEQTRKLALDNPTQRVELRWFIYPRRNRKPGGRFANNLPVASCTWEAGSKKLLRESGYHEMPVIVPRWSLLPESAYGVGPMFDALPDVRQLNDLVFSENAAVDLAVSGMWIAEDDGVLNPRTVKVGPRKVIVANSVDSMKPLLTGADFNVTFTKKEQLQAAIRKTLMADQLQPPTDPRMTATEWLGRMALLRQLLGPRFGRLQAEWLQPMVARCFGIALRAGVLGPLPDELRNRAAAIQYISPLARSQKLEEIAAMDRYEQDLMVTVQAGKPEVADLYDWDQAKRLKAELLGVPLRLIRDQRKVQQVRDARAKDQQAAQQQAIQQQASTAMIDASAQRMANA